MDYDFIGKSHEDIAHDFRSMGIKDCLIAWFLKEKTKASLTDIGKILSNNKDCVNKTYQNFTNRLLREAENCFGLKAKM